MASISVRNGNRMESSNSWHRCANDTADFLYTRNRDHMRKSFNIWLRAQICENHEKTGIQISWHCPFKLQSYGREKTRWSIYFIICSSQLISNSAHLWGLPVFLWQQCAYEYTYIWRSQAGRPRCPGTWAGAAHETGPSQTDPSPIPNTDDRLAEVGWTDLNRGRHHRYTKQCWSSDELNKLSLRQYFFEALKRISHNKTNRQCHLKASKQSRNHVLVIYEQDVFITTDKTKTTTYSIKYVYVCIM